jgi:hypothetical protein
MEKEGELNCKNCAKKLNPWRLILQEIHVVRNIFKENRQKKQLQHNNGVTYFRYQLLKCQPDKKLSPNCFMKRTSTKRFPHQDFLHILFVQTELQKNML